MSNYYNDAIKRFKELGFRYRRKGKGSHELWFDPITNRTLTISRSKTTNPKKRAAIRSDIRKILRLRGEPITRL